MPYSTIVLSPEFVSTNRREALNTTADQRTGTFVQLNADGKFEPATPALGRSYISTQNISTAQDITYRYAADELMFAQILPVGTRVAVCAGAAEEYAAGALVEIGDDGLIVLQTLGVAVGVVVETVTPAIGEHIAIDLI